MVQTSAVQTSDVLDMGERQIRRLRRALEHLWLEHLRLEHLRLEHLRLASDSQLAPVSREAELQPSFGPSLQAVYLSRFGVKPICHVLTLP